VRCKNIYIKIILIRIYYTDFYSECIISQYEYKVDLPIITVELIIHNRIVRSDLCSASFKIVVKKKSYKNR
jgi:hypothetical protein